MCLQLWAKFVWLMSPSVRLPRVEIAGWRHTCRSLVAPSGWWCGWLSGVVPRGVGVGGCTVA